jgi:beta-aspartyl-peptidase (threonine type)
MVKPFIIGTRNSKNMLHLGAVILRMGGSAMNAVEATTNAVEDNPEDTSVGLGGIPNLLGAVQLDASIMDGRTMKTGAVAAVEKYVHVTSIARKVLEVSPHVLLVGPGADLFAGAMGFERRDPTTEGSRYYHDLFLRDAFGEVEDGNRRQHLTAYVENHGMRDWYNRLSDEHHGTVNIMAMDTRGDICSAVSTSGTALKFPGRVGDSPIIGAGNYCDNRVGAAACTGRGELAIRRSTARTIIGYMENGMTLGEAAVQAMVDIHTLEDTGGMNCLALDREGNTISASTNRPSIHYYMDTETECPILKAGVWVKPDGSTIKTDLSKYKD